VLCPPKVVSRLDSITSPQQALQLIASHGSSELGFLQFFNLHRSQPAISQLVRDPQLAGTAAQLLDARRVRLYQVCGWCCVVGVGTHCFVKGKGKGKQLVSQGAYVRVGVLAPVLASCCLCRRPCCLCRCHGILLPLLRPWLLPNRLLPLL
jgi:hypothetical protein